VTESSPLSLPRPFLGVSSSVLGRTWIERCDAAQGTIALAIAQTHGLPDVLARVLAGRGVGVHDTQGFLNPRLRDLMPDPHVLTDMEAAAARLAEAVMRAETVAIFGDYDVDGACSASLLAEYLRGCGIAYAIHIPDRITEGYGPNVDAIRALKQQGADVLVTVDCGTASIEPLAEAKRLGLDAVVLDHHQAPEILPEALAIVNPNRQDDLSGLGSLCAAGVVFLFLVALNRALRSRGFFQNRPEPDLMGSLDLVALATVADVVPLTITGGEGWRRDRWGKTRVMGYWVSKRELCSLLVARLQGERLRFRPGDTLAGVLEGELRDFRVKVTKAANETFEAREGKNDDLVLSVAMGLWVGETGRPRLIRMS